MSLYELTKGYMNLLELMGDPEIPEDIILTAMAEITGSIEDKAEAYAKMRQMLVAEANMFTEEANRLSAKAAARKKSADRLIEHMAACMKIMEKPEIKTPIGTWKFQKNPPKVFITDEKALPLQFWRQAEPEVDKMAIANVIKAGQVVPGATLEQTDSLRFK